MELLHHLFTSARVIILSTSGFVADILSSRCRPMSDHVDSVMSELGVVENVGVTVEIVFVVAMQYGIGSLLFIRLFQSIFGFPAAILDLWKVTNIV